MTNVNKFRIKSAGIHLLLSLTVGILSLCTVFFVWYPSPLYVALGVTQIFLMMLCIDVIMGPLLTFFVAKPNKKSLKFDLSVIVVLQLCALIYGLYSISLSRPAYIAFDIYRFEVVQAKNLFDSQLKLAKSPYNTVPFGKPKWVAVQPAKTASDSFDRTFRALETGFAPTIQPSLYEPLMDGWHRVPPQAEKLKKLKDFNDSAMVDKVLLKYPKAIGYIPMKASDLDMTVLVSEDEVLDIVNLRPW